MAQLRDTFLTGLETLFSIFEEAVKTGIYGIDDENEFTNDPTVPPHTCQVRCLFEQFREKDISLLRFSKLIQPNDIIGIVPCDDVTLEMKSTGGFFTFDEGTYTVVGFEQDPLSIIYTVLMRKN